MNSNMVDRNTSCSEWISRYEELRQAALPGHQLNNNNWGMALFIRHGLVGWMRAWSKSDPPARLEKHQFSTTVASQTTVPSSLRGQITILLANMILNGHKEVAL